MGASYARKRSILQDQKFPQEIITAIYSRAESSIARFVASGATDLSIIDDRIRELESETYDSEGKEQNRDLCVEALRRFRLMSNRLPLTGFNCSKGPTNVDMKVLVSGVEVSVLPQILIEGSTRSGKRIVGGVKFSFPKGAPLNETTAGFLSTLVHWHCCEYLSDRGDPNMKICFSVDVPTSNVFTPPKTYKRRRQQIEEACRQISWQWDNVVPPTGYREP
jgi:hypothetical protein